jgi:integrase
MVRSPFGTNRANRGRFVNDGLTRHLDLYVENEPDALVFTTDNGTPLRASNFRRAFWNQALTDTGLEGLTPHDLRYTAGALLISEGAHPRQVMEHLGHSNISTTMNVYGEVFPDDMDELADRLDERHRTQIG